jgi:hypothetical protein
MSSQSPEKPLELVTDNKNAALPDPLRAFVDDTSAGRLLYVHMVVLRKLLERMRERGSITHAEALRLLLDTVHECAPQGTLRSEDKAARDILWATIVEQIESSPDLTVVKDG